MGNLHWLVPMALSVAQGKDHCPNFEIRESFNKWFYNDNTLKSGDYINNG